MAAGRETPSGHSYRAKTLTPGKSLAGPPMSLIAGENPGDGIAQGQPNHRHGAANSRQVVSYVAFNVQPLMHAFTQLLHGVVQLPAFVRRAFLQYVYGNSFSHAVLASFWIQTWSCCSTLSVRVGANFVAFISE